MENSRAPAITVLGIGNILLRDDGVGIRALEALRRDFSFGGNVTLIDGGTTIFHNMGIFAGAEKMIVFDAVKLDGPPGTVYAFNSDEYRVKMPRKATSHDVGVLNTLSMMELIGQKPPEVIIIGVQPKEYDTWSEELTPEVTAAIPEMIRRAVAQLAKWGSVPAAGQAV